MPNRVDILFTEFPLPRLTLPNRLVRSATYEGWGDGAGAPRAGLGACYAELARGGVGTLITGFVYTTPAGHAMHRGQCGIDADDKIAPWQAVVAEARAAAPAMKLFMQLAHTGRQTRREVTGLPVVGASSKRCGYCRQRVRALDDAAIRTIIDEFAAAAFRAREAGFDGVQVHAAHGYLIHQFLSRDTNTRTDRWGEERTLLLEEIIRAIRHRCGDPFPVLVKLSAADDLPAGVRIDDTIHTVQRLEALDVDAVEISYGTMEYALNIIRGAIPLQVALKVNPLYSRFPPLVQWAWKTCCFPAWRRRMIPFSEGYNLSWARQIKRETWLPVITVGGIRTLGAMVECIAVDALDAIALCRPLICDPDLPMQIREGRFQRSRCTNCNLCTIHCDGTEPLRCYQKEHPREDTRP